jgi:hypothetical protein
MSKLTSPGKTIFQLGPRCCIFQGTILLKIGLYNLQPPCTRRCFEV